MLLLVRLKGDGAPPRSMKRSKGRRCDPAPIGVLMLLLTRRLLLDPCAFKLPRRSRRRSFGHHSLTQSSCEPKKPEKDESALLSIEPPAAFSHPSGTFPYLFLSDLTTSPNLWLVRI